MSGSPRLKDEERQEMLLDAQDRPRGEAFLALKDRCHTGTIDEYIEILSDNMGSFHLFPSKKISDHFKL